MTKRIERPSVQHGYDLWAPHYDVTDNPIVHIDRRHALQALDPQPGERILDAGCGTGAHLDALQGCGTRPVGIDFSRGMLALAARRPGGQRLVVGDLHEPLPFRDRVFDAVLCSLVSEHLDSLHGFFGELQRTLIPGGRLVFSAFHPRLAASGVEANFEVHGVEYRLGAVPHTEEDFRTALEAKGLEQIESSTLMGDATMVEALPRARRYLGQPLVLLLCARRSR